MHRPLARRGRLATEVSNARYIAVTNGKGSHHASGTPTVSR